MNVENEKFGMIPTGDGRTTAVLFLNGSARFFDTNKALLQSVCNNIGQMARAGGQTKEINQRTVDNLLSKRNPTPEEEKPLTEELIRVGQQFNVGLISFAGAVVKNASSMYRGLPSESIAITDFPRTD